jgi:hypothetical protein
MLYFAPGSYLTDNDYLRDYHIQGQALGYRILHQYAAQSHYHYHIIRYCMAEGRNTLMVNKDVKLCEGDKHNMLCAHVKHAMNNIEINTITILLGFNHHATIFYINKENKSSIYYNPHGPDKDYDVDQNVHVQLITIMQEYECTHLENFPLTHQTNLPKCQMYCVYFIIKMLDLNTSYDDKVKHFTNRTSRFNIMKFERSITNKRILQYCEARDLHF